MILREIKNIFIKNRLTEGVDFVRKEWLQGRNGAYINTNHKPVTIEDRFECSIKYNGNSVNPNNREQWIFGVWNNNDVIGNYIARADNKLGVLYKVDNQLWCRCTENHIHKFETFVNGSSFYCIDNGLQFSNSTNGLTEKTINSPYYLYACNGLDVVQYFHGDIAYFKITDTSSNVKMHLIPCTLLHSIPRNLDAQCKERQAGECGMIDLISGKFYGNVANSGTFTVEGEVTPETHTGLQQIYQNKLIEGEDYQTYDWLKADIPIGKTMMRLPINSRNFEWKRKFIQVGHSAYMYGDTLNYAAAAQLGVECSISIYNNKISRNVGIFGTNPTGRLIELIGTDDSLTIDNISVSLGDLTKIIAFDAVANSQRKCIFLTSSIKVDGVTRYVPCQLLKSIPRNLDAQCKDRVAGECGMIDLISGKFYGNVASSGTFTVENDTENNE